MIVMSGLIGQAFHLVPSLWDLIVAQPTQGLRPGLDYSAPTELICRSFNPLRFR